jgi:hypothetical protein
VEPTRREERAGRLAAEAERITQILVRRGATLVLAFGSFAREDVGASATSTSSP